MPVYDVSAAAEALDIDPKQLDNIISRNKIAGVERKRRGVTRLLTSDAIVAIRIALELVRALKVPVAQAVDAAVEVARRDGAIALGGFVKLRVDIPAIRTATAKRLDAAVESVGRRPRGRPASRKPEPDRASKS